MKPILLLLIVVVIFVSGCRSTDSTTAMREAAKAAGNDLKWYKPHASEADYFNAFFTCRDKQLFHCSFDFATLTVILDDEYYQDCMKNLGYTTKAK